MRDLLEKSEKGVVYFISIIHIQLIPKFKFISINGMMLSEPNQAYSLLLRDLSDKSEKHAPAQVFACI